MEWRTWLTAEVESESSARQPAEPSEEPGQASTPSYLIEADGRSSKRRIHQIALKYAPGGNYRVGGTVSLEGTEDSEELRFSVPADDASAVLKQIQQEPGVRRAWLGESFPNT